MKTFLTTAAILGILLGSAGARTWTSADGSRTFEGELRSYIPATGMVTVLVNGRALEFHRDKLSAEDLAFLKESGSAPTGKEMAASPDTDTELGAKVAKAKLQKLDGERYRRAELEKAPKYYILYYSASW